MKDSITFYGKILQETSNHILSCLCVSVFNALRARIKTKNVNKRKLLTAHFSKSPPASELVLCRVEPWIYEGIGLSGSICINVFSSYRGNSGLFCVSEKADGKSESWPRVVLK